LLANAIGISRGGMVFDSNAVLPRPRPGDDPPSGAQPDPTRNGLKYLRRPYTSRGAATAMVRRTDSDQNRRDVGTPRDLLGAGRSVLDLTGFPQRIDRFVDRQENSRFERAERTAATNCHGNRCHRHVVGGLP